MKKPHHPAIRELLRQHPDGLTLQQITSELGISHVKTTNRCVMAMPDVYIDRWTKTRNSRGQYLAIYCVWTPPPNCPYPTDRFEGETRWANSTNITLGAA